MVSGCKKALYQAGTGVSQWEQHLCREYTPPITVGVPVVIIYIYKRPRESSLDMIFLTPRPPLSTAVSFCARGNDSHVDI